jgi:hypothetical protein
MFSRKPPKPTASRERKLAPTELSPWRAVSIVPGERACAIVLGKTESRWLCAEAPRLPLTGCDAARCDCRYKHFPDRRVSERRRIDRTGLPRQHDGREQRAPRRGRRLTD